MLDGTFDGMFGGRSLLSGDAVLVRCFAVARDVLAAPVSNDAADESVAGSRRVVGGLCGLSVSLNAESAVESRAEAGMLELENGVCQPPPKTRLPEPQRNRNDKTKRAAAQDDRKKTRNAVRASAAAAAEAATAA